MRKLSIPQVSSARIRRDEGRVQGDFLIKDWLVQPQINTVEKGGKRWHLEPKVMQVLVQLSLRPGEVLSKEKLIEAVWRDTFVGDDVLVRCISEIRYVFGDDAKSPSIVQTIPKTGYRLIAAVDMQMATAEQLRSSVANSLNHHLAGTTQESAAHSNQTAVGVDDPPADTHPDASKEPPASEAAPRFETNHPPSDRTHAPVAGPLWHRLLWLLPVATVALALWGATWYWQSSHPSPFDVFWAPVLDTPDPALFCIADQNQYSFITLRDAAEPSKRVALKDNLSAVVIDDLDTIVRVAAALRTHGKQYQLRGEESTTLTDLRNGPSIFIGAFDNAWTLRLTKPLRFHFANNTDMTQFRIVDANAPNQPGWVVDRTQQMATNNYQDYALIARFTDSNTGEPTVIVAGIGRGGTITAGEFLTDPDHLSQLMTAAQAAGSKKNLEIVLSTEIIDGKPGSPKMEATYFW
jgi:DNA-binding winged helix-turn-helix (wHTH) protein